MAFIVLLYLYWVNLCFCSKSSFRVLYIYVYIYIYLFIYIYSFQCCFKISRHGWKQNDFQGVVGPCDQVSFSFATMFFFLRRGPPTPMPRFPPRNSRPYQRIMNHHHPHERTLHFKFLILFLETPQKFDVKLTCSRQRGSVHSFEYSTKLHIPVCIHISLSYNIFWSIKGDSWKKDFWSTPI